MVLSIVWCLIAQPKMKNHNMVIGRFEIHFGWTIVMGLILNVNGREIVKIKNTTTHILTSTTRYGTDFTDIIFDQTKCAFMNVSDNASYYMYDREESSEGLSWIHNTSDIFENFYSIAIKEGCEVTICQLQLLNIRGRVRKCYTSGTPLWDELQLQNLISTNLTLQSKAPDPVTHFKYYRDSSFKFRGCNLCNQTQLGLNLLKYIVGYYLETVIPDDLNREEMTSQYFVSTGCSCQKPGINCSDPTCENVLLEDHECGRLYREPNCAQCRYDADSLIESDSFSPSNTFWCQSFVIREGCRLNIGSYQSEYKNVRYYSGRRNYVEMDYVRYPIPSILTCSCEVQDLVEEPENSFVVTAIYWTLPLAVFMALCLSVVVLGLGLYKCGVPLQIGKWSSQPRFKDVISKFQHGFTNEAVQTDDDDGYECVSIRFLAAVQQPYQRKWEIPRENIEIDFSQPPLGTGHLGIVYLGLQKLQDGTARKVAVKTAKNKFDMTQFASILDEIKIRGFIGSHPNICCPIGACTQNIQQREVLIILELCYPGNLKDYLKTNRSSFLGSHTFNPKKCISKNGYCDMNMSKIKPKKQEALINWSAQIACGMEFLWEKQVIHIDLACRNVFLTDDLNCKIGDFGLSQKIQDVRNYVRVGNNQDLPFKWMSLESLTDLKFTHESDVWSYGVTLYEIFSLGEEPFPDIQSPGVLTDKLLTGERLTKPAHCSDKIYEIMLQSWQVEPETRPTFMELRRFFNLQQNES